MNKHPGTIVFIFLLLVCPGAVWAVSFGGLADMLMVPTTFLTKLIDIAVYVVGVVFILLSFAQYKIHRQSPKLVPLMTPILLFILGIVALLIPHWTTLTKTGKTIQGEQPKKQTVLPMPDLEQEKRPTLPLPTPTRPTRSDPQARPTPPPPPSSPSGSSGGSSRGSSGGGHWTDDPNYR